jgi:nucleoside-diphosphate-sugar epimerase
VNTLLIFGLGYSARAVAEAVPDFTVVATSRSVEARAQPSQVAPGDAPPLSLRAERSNLLTREMRGSSRRFAPRDDRRTSDALTVAIVPFDAAEAAIAAATHILVTAPPAPIGDPVLHRYAEVIAAAPGLRWIGYLSSTVVYGDRGGAWVDEETTPAPSQPRGQRRLDAELAWSRFAPSHAVDLFRLAGIYGPGRSAFDDLRAGSARRLSKPGHQFGRIHRDDIGRAVAAAMRQARGPGRRVLNLADDVPSESAAVVTEAARLLGVPPPPEIAFADALSAMSPMARSFWAENRKVGSRKTQQALGLRWLYPSFREGLAAIWREERGDRPP